MCWPWVKHTCVYTHVQLALLRAADTSAAIQLIGDWTAHVCSAGPSLAGSRSAAPIEQFTIHDMQSGNLSSAARVCDLTWALPHELSWLSMQCFTIETVDTGLAWVPLSAEC